MLTVATALLAADDRQLVLALKAQSDFDRVELTAAPQARDTSACLQSQAALLPMAAPEEKPLILFRKGYCALIGGALANDASQFGDAVAAFDQATEAWQARAIPAKQQLSAPPIPSAVRVFSAVSRLEQNPAAGLSSQQEAQLMSAVDHPACESVLTAPASCQTSIQLGNFWLGWIALRRGDAYAAMRRFTESQAPGWLQWVQGQEAFRARDYAKAADDYQNAVETFRKAQRSAAAPLLQRLGPQPEIAAMLTELGAAQLLAHRVDAAIATLDAAVKADPFKPRTLYLRARAKQTAGQSEAALADYNLASRTAFAAAPGQSSGEAHLYQGILLYERKDWRRAEDEFASALNLDIAEPSKADAAAWRHLAAVASGSCGASRTSLERSLGAVSPDFPKDDARSVLAACATTPSAVGDR